MDLKGKRVLVAGCGKSGIGSAKFLLKLQADPMLYDENEKAQAGELEGKVPLYTGKLSKELEEACELLVLSPGIPVDHPLVLRMKERNIPVWGEIELAFHYERGKLAAITGTNGKTTTTTLVGEMLKAHYNKSFVVGNIGYPYTDVVLETEGGSATVGEISSFQLETIEEFHPHVSAVLNVTPDHLNRHHTMENYVAAKREIMKNQTGEDVCVLNYENEYTRDMAKDCPAKVVFFSSQRPLENGFYLEGEEIIKAESGKKERLMGVHDMNLVGICNIENVMAALAMGEAMDIPMEKLLDVVRNFHAVEHRIEYVDSVGDILFYNDSKGTNPDAAIQGIRAMSRPTLLIGGGYDKESSYDEWIEAFNGKVKKLVLIGQTREKIAECAKKHGFYEILMADSLEEAFRKCVEDAEAGDAVLLSPACASWGMFPNYEVRGQEFKNLVKEYKEKEE